MVNTDNTPPPVFLRAALYRTRQALAPCYFEIAWR